jgi:diguanylate cyclase
MNNLFKRNEELQRFLTERHHEIVSALGEDLMPHLYKLINDAHDEREEVKLLLETDKLTGLVKKDFFEMRLEEALKYAALKNEQVALMFIDLDRFKKINDRRGHDVGDDILGVASLRLLRGLRGKNPPLHRGLGRRDEDVAVRWGGDEFAIIAHVSGEQEALELAARISGEFEGPISLGSSLNERLGLSIGIALGPRPGEDLKGMNERADTAMYQAKERLNNSKVSEEKRHPWRLAP